MSQNTILKLAEQSLLWVEADAFENLTSEAGRATTLDEALALWPTIRGASGRGIAGKFAIQALAITMQTKSLSVLERVRQVRKEKASFGRSGSSPMVLLHGTDSVLIGHEQASGWK